MNGESVMAVPSTSLSHILSIAHNTNNQQYEVSNLRPVTMSMSLRIKLHGSEHDVRQSLSDVSLHVYCNSVNL